MPPSRRGLVCAAIAAAALAGAGCARRTHRGEPTPVRGLEVARLADAFPPLARRAAPAAFDLGVITLDTAASWSGDSNRRFPMDGLIAAPVAAAALAEVDAGRLRLNDRIAVRALDLSPPPSRVNRAFPPGDGGEALVLPAADLIALATQDGDRTATDALMAHVGGPGAVTAWLRQRDIQEMRIDRYLREVATEMSGLASFRAGWKDDRAWAAARDSLAPGAREAATARYLADPRDTTTVPAALSFLRQLAAGELLSRGSTRLLLELMATTARPSPLRAGLPRGADLARAGAVSDTDLGLTPVANAMGVVTLPNGRRFALAAFLAGSTATAVQRERLFADAARLTVSAVG